ncbi:MAG: hypothetical protein HWE10_05705 [Gammaproteobacteria bacterium]|nr:hypothetical protein [Gammaproteobacteria bacterium]
MKLTKLLFIFSMIALLISCGEKNENLPAFANPDAPEYRALRFFDALYNEKNLSKAQQYSTAKLARILRSYGTVRGYTRYVINLQIDPGVKLKVDRSLNQVSTNKSNVTYVNILFDGIHNDSPVKDVRKVNFVRIDGEWLIDEIEDDPYMKSGI